MVACSVVAAPENVCSVVTEPLVVGNFVVVTSTVVLSFVDENSSVLLRVVLDSVLGFIVVDDFVVIASVTLCSVVREPMVVDNILVVMSMVFLSSVDGNLLLVWCVGVVSSVLEFTVIRNSVIAATVVLSLVVPDKVGVCLLVEAPDLGISSVVTNGMVPGCFVLVKTDIVLSSVTKPFVVGDFVVATSTVVLTFVDENSSVLLGVVLDSVLGFIVVDGFVVIASVMLCSVVRESMVVGSFVLVTSTVGLSSVDGNLLLVRCVGVPGSVLRFTLVRDSVAAANVVLSLVVPDIVDVCLVFAEPDVGIRSVVTNAMVAGCFVLVKTAIVLPLVTEPLVVGNFVAITSTVVLCSVDKNPLLLWRMVLGSVLGFIVVGDFVGIAYVMLCSVVTTSAVVSCVVAASDVVCSMVTEPMVVGSFEVVISSFVLSSVDGNLLLWCVGVLSAVLR